MSDKKRKEKAVDKEQAAPVEEADVEAPRMVLEGDEALDLYVRQISFNLTELEKQVELLRQACNKTSKLLREVE